MNTKKMKLTPEAKAAAEQAIRAYFEELGRDVAPDANAKFVDLIKNWK